MCRRVIEETKIVRRDYKGLNKKHNASIEMEAVQIPDQELHDMFGIAPSA
jgi:hypothetical protein